MSRLRRAYLALPRPTLFGHRGCRGAAPENTLAAFAVARDAGADAVELDVRPTRDGEVVVMHDPTLARTAGDPRTVADLDWSSLADVRVDGERVPTLFEAIRFCSDAGLAMNVELKRDVPSRGRATRLAARVLRCKSPPRGLVVSSFDPAMLALFRVLAPGIPTALLLEPDTARRYPLDAVAPWLGLAVHPERSLVDATSLARWHSHGLRVNVWTVNEPEELRRLTTLGVDGLICDDPARARAILSERSTR